MDYSLVVANGLAKLKKLRIMLCGATQGGWVILEGSGGPLEEGVANPSITLAMTTP